MIKRVLIAAAIMIATPGFLFSQDIFFSFSNTELATEATLEAGQSGTAYLFAAPAIDFDAADLDFTSSDAGVAALTGGLGIDGAFNTVGNTKFNSSEVTIGSTSAGNWFAVNVTQNGVNPGLAPLFDPNFVAGVGSLLASVDFDAVAEGSSTFELALGNQGVLNLPDTNLTPAFGSATLTVTGGQTAVPEPSSAMLLIVGTVGLVARRRKV